MSERIGSSTADASAWPRGAGESERQVSPQSANPQHKKLLDPPTRTCCLGCHSVAPLCACALRCLATSLYGGTVARHRSAFL
eukprot:6175917-Pleurochrysis_carterae.AAC.1